MDPFCVIIQKTRWISGFVLKAKGEFAAVGRRATKLEFLVVIIVVFLDWAKFLNFIAESNVFV